MDYVSVVSSRPTWTLVRYCTARSKLYEEVPSRDETLYIHLYNNTPALKLYCTSSSLPHNVHEIVNFKRTVGTSYVCVCWGGYPFLALPCIVSSLRVTVDGQSLHHSMSNCNIKICNGFERSFGCFFSLSQQRDDTTKTTFTEAEWTGNLSRLRK